MEQFCNSIFQSYHLYLIYTYMYIIIYLVTCALGLFPILTFDNNTQQNTYTNYHYQPLHQRQSPFILE